MIGHWDAIPERGADRFFALKGASVEACMPIPFSILALIGTLSIALFLAALNLAFWQVQREDRAPLWLAAWLLASAVFAACRILQYGELNGWLHILTPRILLTAAYLLAWLGIEFTNAFVSYHPPRRERALFMALVAAPILLLWTSNLILTDQTLVRVVPFGGNYTGVLSGSLYLPASFLILVIGAAPVYRLMRAPQYRKRENLMLAAGFACILLFSLNDFLAVSFNLDWIRLSDYSYLPIAIFFGFIQMQRFGLLYRDMSTMVQKRTAKLDRLNETLVGEITRHKQAEIALRESEQKYRTVVEKAKVGITIIQNGLVRYANPQLAEIRGEEISTIIGQHFGAFIHPAERSKIIERYRKRQAGGNEPATYETVLLHKDGSPIYVEITTGLISYEGAPAEIVIVQNLTERRQKEEMIRRQAKEMASLYETTHDLVIEQNLSRLLHTIVERAVRLLNASGGGLYLCEPEQGQVRCVISYNTPHDYTGVVLKYGEGMAGWIAKTGKPLIVGDYRVWQGRAAVYEKDQPFASVLGVPMLWQERVIGVLHVIENRRTGAFSEEDQRLLTLFANQTAIAVENARLFKAEERRRREAAAITEVGRDISASLELEVVLERLASNAKELLQVETSAVYLAEPGKPILRAIAALGPDADEIKQDPLQLGDGILGAIAARKTGEIVNNSAADPRGITIQGTEDTPNEHILGAPILLGDQLTGLVAVWRSGVGKEFVSADLVFLTSLAQQAAIAIQNARLFRAEQIRRQEAETLRDAAQKITSTLDQEQVIQLVLEQLAKVVPYDSASVQLLREGYLEVIGGRGWPDPTAVLGLRFPVPGGNPNTVVVREQRPVIVGDARKDYPAFTQLPHRHIQSWLGAPLIARGRVIGMFAVDHSQVDKFTEADAQLVNAFAAQAAIAIENARLYEETQKRLRELEGIAKVSATLSTTLELETLLETVLQSIICTVSAAERGSILLADEEKQLHIRAVWGYSDPRTRALIFSPETGYATVSFQERRAIVIPDVRADARIRYEGEIPEMLSGGSAIAAPLIVKDRVIGVIAIDAPVVTDAFDEEDLYLLETIAAPAALAIENARLFEDTRRRLAELEILQTIASALRVAQTPDEAIPIVLDRLVELLDFGSALIDLIDPDSKEIVTVEAHGVWSPMTGRRTPLEAGGSGHVIATGKPYITTDVIADGLVAFPELVGALNSVACVPIVAQHQPIGTLWVGRQSSSPVNKEELNLLIALGEMVGNTIQRMALYTQTVHQADEIAAAYDLTLEGWAKALELRDKETEGHSRRVTYLTLQMARRFGFSEEEQAHIRRGVLLHDIGKMGIPDQVLKKTGPLDREEWLEMKKHPQFAYDLLHPITYLRPALDIPYCHHEKWDGSGYPRQLKGEEIPLAARIFAVVDVFDALLSDRPYRLAWPKEKVVEYLYEQSGKHFDPRVVVEFMTLLNTGVFTSV